MSNDLFLHSVFGRQVSIFSLDLLRIILFVDIFFYLGHTQSSEVARCHNKYSLTRTSKFCINLNIYFILLSEMNKSCIFSTFLLKVNIGHYYI
jgi:hypothetical protein